MQLDAATSLDSQGQCQIGHVEEQRGEGSWWQIGSTATGQPAHRLGTVLGGGVPEEDVDVARRGRVEAMMGGVEEPITMVSRVDAVNTSRG